MGAPNKSRLSWAYQTAAGTEAIDDATDTTYFFGDFSAECDSWACPFTTNDIIAYWKYAARTPNLTDKEKKYDTYRISFHPRTPQYLNWMLKSATDASPDTIQALETGLFPNPLTIRWDFTGGTVDKVIQTVDNYCVGLHCTAARGSPFLVECEWAFGRLEDGRGEWKYDDTCSAVNTGAKTITLTDHNLVGANAWAGYEVFVNSGDHEDDSYTIVSNTNATPTVLTVDVTPGASLAADTLKIFDKIRPVLTTAPVMAGNDATNVINNYDGRPQVNWDSAGADTAFNEVWKAEWQIKQNWKGVPDENEVYQTVYHYTYEPVDIILNAILETNKQWTDYIDRETRNITICIWKPDMTNYVDHTFTNCHIIGVQETGIKNKGHYEAIISLKAEKCEATFLFEGTDTWGTHFK